MGYVFGFRFGGSSFRRLKSAACIIAVSSLFAAIALSALCSNAMAGTETGEFCPTCPDWTNLEGWMAQKEAYDQAQHTGVYAANNGKANENKVNSNSNNAKAEKPQVKGYPEPEIITNAGSSMKGKVILDVRSPEDYRHGHIPGARNIYWSSIQSDDALDPALAKSALRNAGINNTDDILIYGGSDEGASFMFWALSYLGHRSLSRLDGGVDAAWGAGIKPDKTPASVRESNYTINMIPWMLVNESNLKAILKLNKIQILDARDFADYGMSRLTSEAIPFQADKFYDDYKIKDVSTLEDLLNRRGLDDNSTVLVYGTPQAYDLFYGLKLMGYNTTLLEGDWWSETKWAVSNVREN